MSEKKRQVAEEVLRITNGKEVIVLAPGEAICPTCNGLGRWNSCFDCGNRGYLFPHEVAQSDGRIAERTDAAGDYDSRPETLAHIGRVQELLAQVRRELADRGRDHDLSKMEPPELDTFNEYTPKLKASTYGSDEYKGYLEGMAGGLRHHYAENRHHPEHFSDGIDGMTLIDLVEMLADWKAATERHDNGDMARSLRIQNDRFRISSQLSRVLWNTVDALGWWTARNEECAHDE